MNPSASTDGRRAHIISASGMMNGGRFFITHSPMLPDENATVSLSATQAGGTLGRRVSDGEKQVKSLVNGFRCAARIEKIGGFSAYTLTERSCALAAGPAAAAEKSFRRPRRSGSR
jgi:metallo-beta-lactamase family protein